MLQAVVNAFKIVDLRAKIIFTLSMLLVFRLVAHIPVPGADLSRLQNLLDPNANQFAGLFNVLNIFSGGTLENFSVAAMGVYPYITASIIIQLLTGVIPRFTELSKEGEAGRNQLNKYTHWLTLPLATLQAFGQAQLINSQFQALPQFGLFTNTFYTLVVVISLVCGTMFLVWIGELITEKGIGQGISIIIFGGIVAGLPAQLAQLWQSGEAGGSIFSIFLFIVLGLVTVVGIILINEGQRRIPVHYSRSIIRGGRMMRQAGSSFIPLRVNSSGMIPLIFALSIMSFPVIIAGFFTAAATDWVRNGALWVYNFFQPTTLAYNIVYFLMVVLFTFFYTSVVFQQQRIAENLQKSGGAVPGIRPGPNTDRFLNTILSRITVAGALFLGVVAVAPFLASIVTGVTVLTFGSTALLIVVGVAVDTMKQLEAQLLMRRYEGFINR